MHGEKNPTIIDVTERRQLLEQSQRAELSKYAEVSLHRHKQSPRDQSAGPQTRSHQRLIDRLKFSNYLSLTNRIEKIYGFDAQISTDNLT